MRLDVTSTNGGVFLFRNSQGTGYVRNNPLRFIDPNGEDLYVYYQFSGDLTEEQKKFLMANLQRIATQIQKKYEAAGIGQVTLKDASKLADDQKSHMFWYKGVDLLTFANKSFVNSAGQTVTAPSSRMGQSAGNENNYDPRSMVFLGNIRYSTEDERAFRVAEAASHEIGHGIGLRQVDSYLRRWFPSSQSIDIMTEGQAWSRHPGYVDTIRNKRVLDELKKITKDPLEK
ncbi:MAG: hypothetical protein LC130_08820 [Bryobacterales bacterium]|nr:hypothetical protein [Bryobacterales bacterium]